MLQRASKITPGAKTIEDFKRGADVMPEIADKEPTRKITHHIREANWRKLKKLSTDLSLSSGSRVTINMILDMALDKFFGEIETEGHKAIITENHKTIKP